MKAHKERMVGGNRGCLVCEVQYASFMSHLAIPQVRVGWPLGCRQRQPDF